MPSQSSSVNERALTRRPDPGVLQQLLQAQPADCAQYVFENVGSVFINAASYNFDESSTYWSPAMAPAALDPNKSLANNVNGASATDSASLSTTSQARSREQTPERYSSLEQDSFRAGKYFELWAPEDLEIHKKRFILLTSRRSSGTGILVKLLNHEELHALVRSPSSHSEFLRLKRSGTPSQAEAFPEEALRPLCTQLEAITVHRCNDEDVQPGMIVHLKHTFNIPSKYKRLDLGVLNGTPLRNLRVRYLACLADEWGVEEDLEKYFQEKRG